MMLDLLLLFIITRLSPVHSLPLLCKLHLKPFLFLTDPCAMMPCTNYGTCLRDGTTFNCECFGNFFGERCQYGNNVIVSYTKNISK